MSYYLLGFIFLALFTLSFWGLYTFLKKKYPNIDLSNTINLGMFLLAFLTVIATFISFGNWKDQHYLNNKEKIIEQVIDQLKESDTKIKTYQRLDNDIVNEASLPLRKDVFNAYDQANFESKKLELLLLKASETIQSSCTKKQLSALKIFENDLLLQIASYSKIDSTRKNDPDSYNILNKNELKKEEALYSVMQSDLRSDWNNLSLNILATFIKWSGSPILEHPINTTEESCSININSIKNNY